MAAWSSKTKGGKDGTGGPEGTVASLVGSSKELGRAMFKTGAKVAKSKAAAMAQAAGVNVESLLGLAGPGDSVLVCCPYVAESVATKGLAEVEEAIVNVQSSLESFHAANSGTEQ